MKTLFRRKINFHLEGFEEKSLKKYFFHVVFLVEKELDMEMNRQKVSGGHTSFFLLPSQVFRLIMSMRQL